MWQGYSKIIKIDKRVKVYIYSLWNTSALTRKNSLIMRCFNCSQLKCLKFRTIMLTLCSIRSHTYYALNYAGIIGWSLQPLYWLIFMLRQSIHTTPYMYCILQIFLLCVSGISMCISILYQNLILDFLSIGQPTLPPLLVYGWTV